MELQVLKLNGSQASKVKIDKSVFGIKLNESAVHQAVVAELTNCRRGTHAAKSRGLVRGGGKKPWRQKGRGVARAGTIRSPLWRGGGVVFGPEPHLHLKFIPRKVKQQARMCVLTAKYSEGNVLVVDELKLENPKTKEFTSILDSLNIRNKKVTVLPAILDNNLVLAVRNIPGIKVVKATDASTLQLLDNEVLLFDKAGLTLLNEQLKNSK